ncbi:MAG: hypothetical protein CMO61_11620 [Verrucomicrobiales bacterium]|nr:hypothetical protein [Verrucomicrobiales bacterium]|tara:strand:- start:1015 stop:2067 length:1053 start_codon:yes stop_codon:yes gene_type:complete
MSGVKSAFDSYIRVADRGFGMSSLWLGDEHLVYVRGTGMLMPFREEYKRYRYRDIQAISVAKTSRVAGFVSYSLGVMLCAGSMAIIFVLTGYEDASIAKIVFLSLLCLAAGIFAAGLIRHLILGPTCVCDIQTRLSRDRLKPLDRYTKAQRVVGQLEGLVREVQEDLTVSASREGSDQPKRPVKTRVVELFELPRSVTISFGFSAGIGVIFLLALHLESLFFTGTALALLVGLSLNLTLALILSIKKATPDGIRSILWVQLGILFLLTASGTIYYLLVATQNPEYTIGISGPLEAFTAVASEGGLVGYLTMLGLSLGILVSGIVGLASARRWKATIAKVESGVGVEALDQ